MRHAQLKPTWRCPQVRALWQFEQTTTGTETRVPLMNRTKYPNCKEFLGVLPKPLYNMNACPLWTFYSGPKIWKSQLQAICRMLEHQSHSIQLVLKPSGHIRMAAVIQQGDVCDLGMHLLKLLTVVIWFNSTFLWFESPEVSESLQTPTTITHDLRVHNMLHKCVL